VLSLHSGGATLRLTTDGRISIRNTAEYNGGLLLSKSQLKQRQIIHRVRFEARFPQLSQVPFETSWSCIEGISRNGTSFFGKVNEHIYYAGGYNGSGVCRGTAFGTALADWSAGNISQLIEDCLGYPKASWLPPRPLLDVGAWFTVRNRFRGVGKDR
jgi:glycine/D-amino acid oxidase-like deaminating enzyme